MAHRTTQTGLTFDQRQFSGFELGQVAGLLNLFRQIGGSIGIALIDTLLARNINSNYNELITHVSSLNSNAVDSFNAAVLGLSSSFIKDIGLSHSSNAALQIIYMRVQGQAFILSFLQLVEVMMLIFAISFVPLFLIKLKKKVHNIADAH